MDEPDLNTEHPRNRPWPVFLVFLGLGLRSFGGPIAHLAYFREAFVVRRPWMSESEYADLVALCQFLPGPASSQVGFGIGYRIAGLPGALAAWFGFTMPSAVFMACFGLFMLNGGGEISDGLLKGLKLVALVVVVQAIWGMGKSLCPDPLRATFMLITAALFLLSPSPYSSVIIITLAALMGLLLFSGDAESGGGAPPRKLKSLLYLAAFFLLLVGLPLISFGEVSSVDLFDKFYRAGSLVFGGGHVVLPLLQSELVSSGLVTPDVFLAGYGLVQAMPGPLFTFSSYLGAVNGSGTSGLVGALVALLAIFLPSFLLLLAALPYWDWLRSRGRVRAALTGVNASVVGLLVAALYDPVWVQAIHSKEDMCFALIAFLLLMYWKLPVWLLVPLGASAGLLLL